MSVQYLLDGYNIIHQIPRFVHKSLEDQRNGLIEWIDLARPQGSPKNKVTIIFDGKPGRSYPKDSESVAFIFSENESADDRIKRIIAGSRLKKEYIVVTDDKALGLGVRAMGARWISVPDFLSKTSAGKPPKPLAGSKPRPKEETSKNITSVLEYKINEELKKVWLRQGKSR